MQGDQQRIRKYRGRLGWVGILVAGFSFGCGDEAAAPAEQAGGAEQTAGASGEAGASAGSETGGYAGDAGGEGGAAGDTNEAGAAGVGEPGGAGSGGEGGCSIPECETYKTPPGEQIVPPKSKENASEPDGTTILRHGLSMIRMGERDASGKEDPEAWKDLGFDIDGWASTPEQKYHCIPRENAKPSLVQVDGHGGIDNSFGKNIVNPILGTLFQNLTGQATLSVTSGATTTLLELGKIGDKADYKNLLGSSFPAEGERNAADKILPPPAKDWSKYTWHPFKDGLNPDGTPVAKLQGAYMSDSVWVSGEPSTLRIQIAFEIGATVPFQVYQARVKMDLSDRSHGVAGIVGGVLATNEVKETFKKLAGFLGTQFCEGSIFLDGFLTQVDQASDILQDGTQDPTKECDGISIGLGFESRATRSGDPVSPKPMPDPCNP